MDEQKLLANEPNAIEKKENAMNEAEEVDRLSEYIERVRRGEGFMPWQPQEYPSAAEERFRAEMEERKTALLRGRMHVSRPVMLDEEQRRRALRNIETAQWAQVLRFVPAWRPDKVQNATRKLVRREFNSACRDIYDKWLHMARWRSPLLVLDEAHHAKNDDTRLAKLFRHESEESVALLKNNFDRMLFLSATPFQLGHQELIRVLRSFSAVGVRFSPPTIRSIAFTAAR